MLAFGIGCAERPDPAIAQGKQVFDNTCKVCHAQGINGAPILGNQRMWQDRAAQGEAMLVQHATEGYGLMPAKGGNNALTEQDITSAVRYMLSQLNIKH